MAISAAYHNVPFIVAAPSTSIDLNTPTGDAIVIEQRGASEVVQIRGMDVEDEAGVKESQGKLTTSTVRIAAPGIGVWNPAFDVTPAKLITAIVTERGLVPKTNDAFDLVSYLSK